MVAAVGPDLLWGPGWLQWPQVDFFLATLVEINPDAWKLGIRAQEDWENLNSPFVNLV